VRSVAGLPSSGSRCVKPVAGSASAQTSSESVPSIDGGRGARAARIAGP
jgi:hypothetical protein